jgi:FKBP-type peptidyl-prolyl cis-trans isomerase
MKVCYSILMLLGLLSCGDGGGEKPKPPVQWTPEKSTTLNRELAEEEELQIKLYLAHHTELKMTRTGTGLRYFIYENGNGPNAEIGKVAQVSLVVKLMNGKKCYETKKNGMDEFEIDRSNIESGIQEAMKLMRVGDKAKLIIPLHLAHGISGDQDKIPPLSTLLVDVKFLGLK